MLVTEPMPSSSAFRASSRGPNDPTYGDAAIKANSLRLILNTLAAHTDDLSERARLLDCAADATSLHERLKARRVGVR